MSRLAWAWPGHPIDSTERRRFGPDLVVGSHVQGQRMTRGARAAFAFAEHS